MGVSMGLGRLLRRHHEDEIHDSGGRMPWIYIIALVAMIGMASPALATTYYLDTVSGLDTNPGDADHPWKTFEPVQSRAASGDTVFIQRGNQALYATPWPTLVSYEAKTLQQFGITWEFDNYYSVGQFANGDFWVLGPVVIIAIEPRSTLVGDRIMNGSMVNPSPLNTKQGYDNQMPSNTYDPQLNVALNVSAENTLTLQPHSSLVSTISIEVRLHSNDTHLLSAAVLTVLPSPAPAGSFRPPYCGSDKTPRLNKSMLDYSPLRRLPPVPQTPTLEGVEAMFAAPWIDHRPGWSQRYMHPRNNMSEYGREIHRDIGIGGLMLHLDFTPQQKEKLLIRYVQLGIDLYGIVQAGGYWSNDGGHAGGRKWPILLAGLVLNDPGMKSIGQKSGDYLYSNGYGPGNCPPDYVHFGEDDQTFYVSALDVSLTNGPTWNPDSRDAERIPYTEADIGLPEWGIRHSTHPHMSNKYLSTKYRGVAGCTFNGTALAALLTPEAKALWNHDAYFDYTDRYMVLTAPGGEHSTGVRSWSAFTANMWDTYRVQCGPIWPQTSSAPVLSLIGDRQVTLGQTLTFTVSATGGNGGTLTYSASGVPNGATFSDGTFTWTPTTGDAGSHPVTFTVSDGVAQDSETITITVEKPNAAPILSGIGSQSISENQSLSFSIGATDPDGDPVTYSAAGMPSGASFAGQTFSWTPGFSQAGTYSVTFTASDGKAQDSRTVTISVANVNRPPALASIGDRSIDEGNTLALALSGADPDGTGLTYSATGLPAGANFAGQNFTWTPTDDQAGAHEITFVVSDGTLTDSETVTVMVVSASADHTAPVVGKHSPAPGAIQVPLNNLITLHVSDAGKGVNPGSVAITIDGKVVYQGNTPAYTSAYGNCTRSGVKNDYQFVYQNNQMFDFDHEILVTVNAADLAGNVMSASTYSFATEMRAFGSNRRVSKTTTASKGAPVTVADAAGNIWAAWHAGPVHGRDIYVARLRAGQETFDAPTQITNDFRDQCNPDIALAANGALYVVWQDNRQGHWDIYAAISTSGQTFSKETVVTDANDNQVAPAIAVDSGSPNRIYVTWQDDRHGNQDIYVGTSTNAFASVTTSRVTTSTTDQTEPDLAIGTPGTAYLVWTDARDGQADIYGATSATSWANVPVVTGVGNQTSPAVAAEGQVLHLLWVSDASGDSDVCYAWSNSLPGSPLVGVNVIDDTSGAAQTAPALACTGDGKVFACWKDERNVGPYGADSDVYFAELSFGGARTNILVGDGGAEAGQSEPAIAVGKGGQPYIVWADDRDTAAEIYCAATTYVNPTPLYSTVVAAAAEATIGPAPATITKAGDVSIVVPAGACQSDVRVTISEILNPLISPGDCLGSYDFGPSGIEFDEPVTVTIPYQVAGNRRAKAYWYNALTGALSQQGITDIENITVSGNLHALRFKTTHFTPYYLVASDSDIVAFSSSGGGGGGCSMSATGDGSPGHLLVPFAIVFVAMAVLRRRDRRAARLRVGN